MKVISTIISASLLIGPVAGIFGGKPVSPEEAVDHRDILQKKRYMTGIREAINPNSPNDFSFCGGVLISPSYVLTTASCNKDKKANFVSVGAIYINGDNDGEEIKVVNGTNHPDFDNKTLSYNFAMLKLAKNTDIKPVKLPLADDSDIRTGKWAMAMGWGLTSSPPDGMASEVLLEVDQQLISNEECREKLTSTTIDMTLVCAGGVKGKSPCDGDLGGPLINENANGDGKNVLIGLINSRDERGCGIEGSPAVYSRVSSVLGWIESFTNQDCARSA